MPSSSAGSIRTSAERPSLIFSVSAFGFLPAPGLAPPRLLPSFATVSTPVSLISFEKMLRKSNAAAYGNHIGYWKIQQVNTPFDFRFLCV